MKALLEILGCRLDPVDAQQAADRILALANEAAGAQVVTLGTEMVVHAQSDPQFRAIVNHAALSLCDTVGVLAVARRHGAALRERVAGVELIERLCAGAAARNLAIYFLGGAQGVAADAAASLKARFPQLRVAGTRSGYFAENETPAVVGAIAASGAQLLLAGLGSPRQEYWLAEHLSATGCGAGVGVGGSFDVIGGRIERAPAIVRKLGLEWLYRLVKEPWRWRRQLALPRFVWLVALDELGLRPARNGTTVS
ncbi:MAG TPA: WecB/TagA/CpsF family glycosyltransferase [Candidatus Acidoferrales bacterium]|nr:WecB/TagA/CpsF family glycosyltransferase [Candidatus Acidoferrales bacterium]